jgi:hypothetical protein
MNVFRIGLPLVMSQMSPLIAGGDDVSDEAKLTKYVVSLHFYLGGSGVRARCCGFAGGPCQHRYLRQFGR